MGDDNNVKTESKKIEVVLRDLDILLRKTLGKNLIVDNFTTSNLVPLGENYGSTMLRVDAEVRRDGENSELEKLFLVAKMVPPTEYQKMMFDSPFTFRKEVHMFTDIVPAYKSIEREFGIPETEVFDLLPKFYGSRLSLEEGKDEFDNDAVILMENLKLKNYACGNRMIGVDLAHAKATVEALAHFHAVGVAVKIKKPEVFEEIRSHARSMEFKEEMLSEMHDGIMNDAKRIPALQPHLPRLENVIHSSTAGSWLQPPVEPWATISHTDFWVNNVMFQDNENGEPQGVKIIDFQNYLYQNPLRDLVFFIFSSCNKEVRTFHAADLIDLYYKKFRSHLEKLECDLSEFSRDSYDEQLAKAAFVEFVHCIIMSKVILVDTQRDPSTANFEQMFDKPSTNECLELMAEVSLRFIKENWI